MTYPDFFNQIETITLQDKLSEFLGTFQDGIVTFSYLDIVKSAGHSCPTVAGAYLLCLHGLKELYGTQLPQRGEIFVSFKEKDTDGVAGVIASVVTHITGATKTLGFKGIGNKFVRHSLMKFEDDITSSIKLTRTDNNTSVELVYDPSSIKANPQQKLLMQKIMQNTATSEEKQTFASLWQKRVEDIFNNQNKVIKIL